MNARCPPRTTPLAGSSVSRAIAAERSYGACNYDPLPVVLAHGDGCWLWDERRPPLPRPDERVLGGELRPRASAHRARAGRAGAAARGDLARIPQPLLPLLLQRLCELTGLDRALPSNGGTEAVETALKAARKWGYKVKGIPADRAEIIVCASNFHGRSIAIVGFSSEPQYRDGFGPFPPGFRQIPYGDAAALDAAITPHTAAFLVEPIQGEGGHRRAAGGLSRRTARTSAASTTCC